MKKISFLFIFVALAGMLVTQNIFSDETNTERQLKAEEKQFIQMKGCEKQEQIWQKIIQSKYSELPPYKKFGLGQLIAMARQELGPKTNNITDFSPEGWVKYLHRHGSVAKVKIVPTEEKFTGIFAGADCGILRLSLTYAPKGSKPVAPGLALKVLRDAEHSANISALVSLEGQDKNFNFFEHPMSNIVPPSDKFGQKMVHKLFRKVSEYPEELKTEDMALIRSNGQREQKPLYPRQIFFVPSTDLKFSQEEHEVRDDFAKIPSGTVIYKIYARKSGEENFHFDELTNELQTKFLKEATPIAEIVTTSEFISSEFGDAGIFFRHEWHGRLKKK